MTEDSESELSRRLRSWLVSRGGTVHPSLDLCKLREDCVERGVFSTSPIATGELLLHLPRRCVMCACEYPANIPSGDETLDWMAALEQRLGGKLAPASRTALQLLREDGTAETDWAPYMATLPQHFDGLEEWTVEELNMLRGTALYDRLQAMRDSGSGTLRSPASVVWTHDIAPFISHAADPGSTCYTHEQFARCAAAVRSRGFFDPGEDGSGPYMLPAIDMLNHRRGPGNATSLCVERCGRELAFSMHAERPIAAGEEVMHSYDDSLTDAELLQMYGFVSEGKAGAVPPAARVEVAAVVTACTELCSTMGDQLPWDPQEEVCIHPAS